MDLTKKREPGTGIPGNPYLPDKTGDLQDPASCPVPGICLRTDRHYVPDDHFGKRSEADQGDHRGGQRRAS